jgi:uncharacterized protein
VSEVAIRVLTDTDVVAVAALNASEVPRLGPLTEAELRSHLRRCDLALVAAGPDGALAGFVLALGPGRDYGSENYRYFAARGSDFLYVDRVAVAPRFRRRGLAGRLYDAVEAHARATGYGEVTCEVNVRPLNHASLAFHAGRGFVELGREDRSGGSLRVALLARALR